MTRGPWTRDRVLVAAALASMSFAVYAPVAGYPFILYDDNTYVAWNRTVQDGLTPNGLVWAFTTFLASNWHPLTWLSHMADVDLFGLDAGMHHLVNVAFHAANAVLLFLVLAKASGRTWPSAFAAALFAVHPLHVESVAWVAERKDVLSTFFGLLTLRAYLLYAECPSPRRYLPVAVLLALSLMSKPMLVTLPFALLLLDYWPLERLAHGEIPAPGRPAGRFATASAARLLLEKIPLFLMTAASCAVTFVAQAKGEALWTSLPLSTRLLNAVYAPAAYLSKTLWPASLAVLYPHPGVDFPAGRAAAAGLALAAVTVLVFRHGRRPYLAVGWLWYLGTLVPVVGIVQAGVHAMADRYTYVPLIGIFIMAAWGFADVGERVKAPVSAAAVAAGVVLIALMIAARVQVGHWRSSVDLFGHALEVTKDNWLAETNMGVALERQGDPEHAIAHFRNALRIYPDRPEAHYNLGVTLDRTGNIDEAIAHFRRAVAIKPGYLAARINLGRALFRLGRYQEAEACLREALRQAPDDMTTLLLLNDVLSKAGK